MKTAILLSSMSLIAVALVAAQQKEAPAEQERQVKEAEVPKAALESLKKLANQAAITELAEEIEHGHKFYEGSWKAADGNVDALVTESGDLVETEEAIPSAKAPKAVRDEVDKAAGKDAKVTFEKKTLILYEVHFKKNGKGHEMILTPDGRRYHEEAVDADEKDGDKDED